MHLKPILKQKILASLMWLVAILFIGVLFVTNLTSYEGYGYSYCNDDLKVSFLNRVDAHEAFVTNSPDIQRINDIVVVQHALDEYFGKMGTLPVGSWENLDVLTPGFLEKLPNDPCVEKGYSEYNYEYRVSEDGHAYVLRTKLSDTGDRYVIAQHSEDIDGSVYGLWCGEGKYDREFCVSSHDH